MAKQKEKKAKSVLIYAFYGNEKDELVIETKWYPDMGEIVYGVPRVEIKDNETSIEAAMRWCKDRNLDFVPMKEQGDVNISCFIDPWVSDECISTVYGIINRPFNDGITYSLIDKQEACEVLKKQNMDIATYYLLLMFIAGCMKK